MSSFIHVNYGHSARESEPEDECFYCGKHRSLMAYTYFGAPVCGKCWDKHWRKTEDGKCDPPFSEISHRQSGEWFVEKTVTTFVPASQSTAGREEV